MQHLIGTKFTDDKMLSLLDCFEERKDNEIRSMVTDSADIPTIFEYVLDKSVSKHLCRHLIHTGNLNSYCVFVTNYLDINVISDLRSRKAIAFYDPQDYSKFVDGMKIIPLQTSELKKNVINGKTYKELYPLFDEAFSSTLPPHEWYDLLTQI